MQLPAHDRDAALELTGWFAGTCAAIQGSRQAAAAALQVLAQPSTRSTHRSHACRLLLPASLSKQDRAFWHGLADKAGLSSHSEVRPAGPAAPRRPRAWLTTDAAAAQGLGDERHLIIAQRGAPQAGGHSRRVQEQAKSIWTMCQARSCW